MTRKKRLDFLESYFAGMIVETDLELVKYTFAAEDIKSNSQAFRKPNWGSNLIASKAQCQVVEVSRNVTAIPDHNHLEPAILEFDSQEVKGRSIKS